MKNKEELEKKTGIKCISSIDGIKKWNYAIMNPPYGMGTSTIHLQFVDKCLDIAEQQIVIMPFKFIYKTNKIYDKFKNSDKWNNSLIDVEEVDSSIFSDTSMENVAIYNFNINKDNEEINIISLKNETKTLNKISDYSNLNDYEKDFLKYLYNDHIKDNVVWGGGRGGHTNKKALIRRGITDKNQINKIIENTIRETCQNALKLKGKKVYLLLSHVAGNKFFSNSAGKIFKTIKEIEDYAVECNFGKGFQIMGFENIKQAENCKNALQRPLLRFGFIKAHPGLDVTPRKSYKYIPDIDWENDKAKTDEVLLELCGCPKDKCKEYADYCKKIIDEIDKRNRP